MAQVLFNHHNNCINSNNSNNNNNNKPNLLILIKISKDIKIIHNLINSHHFSFKIYLCLTIS